jgi:hypothetical protein
MSLTESLGAKDQSLQTEKMCLEAVTGEGLELKYARNDLRKTNICLAAVTQNGRHFGTYHILSDKTHCLLMGRNKKWQ